MDFDGSLSCAQLRGDLFVVQTPDQARGNLTLSSRKAMHALDEDIIKPLLRLSASTLFQAACHGLHELFRIDGLGQEIDRAALHRLNHGWHIAAPGHEHYRERAFAFESPLQLEPGQARQAIVEDDARRTRRGALFEKRLCRAERPHGETE